MKKINKNYNVAFTVRENKKGVRNLMQTGETIPSIIASKFKGDILCSTTFKQYHAGRNQGYVTKNNIVVTGEVKMEYTITGPMAYANERYTLDILDVVVRTVIAEYISSLDVYNTDKNWLMSDEDHKLCIDYINYVLKTALPWVRLDNVSRVHIIKYDVPSMENVSKFFIKRYLQLDEAKNEKSMDIEYYKPFMFKVEDDMVSSKYFYPKHRFVAHDQCLYYCGRAKYYGKYHNEKAMGNIVNIGRHVYTPVPVLYSKQRLGVNENLFAIYPAIIYDVTDLRLYLGHYDYEIKELLSKLSREVIRNEARETDTITNIKDLTKMGNTKTLRDLNNYGVYPKVMVYLLKNPFVREEKNIKTSKDIAESIQRGRKGLHK